MQNAIDLDQQALEAQLSLGTDATYAVARQIYEQGAFSKSIATVSVNGTTSSSIPKGTQVVGQTASGDAVSGTVLNDVAAGSTSLQIQYATNEVQDNYVGCQVGANPNPNVEGCFATSGALSIGGTSPVSYTHLTLPTKA